MDLWPDQTEWLFIAAATALTAVFIPLFIFLRRELKRSQDEP